MWEEVFSTWFMAEQIYEALEQEQDEEKKERLKERLLELVKSEKLKREFEQME